MGKLVLKMSMSADGFVAGPNGEIDWLLKSMDESTKSWILNTITQAGVHIMGSRTFYDMMAYWPYSDEPLAAPMNEIPKVVFSRNGLATDSGKDLTTRALRDAKNLQAGHLFKRNPDMPYHINTWNAAMVASGNLSEEILRLKNQICKPILAHGGAGFVRSLVASGLIDEYRLLVHPVLLGKGLSIFNDLEAALDLSLVSTTTLCSGNVAYVYQPRVLADASRSIA